MLVRDGVGGDGLDVLGLHDVVLERAQGKIMPYGDLSMPRPPQPGRSRAGAGGQKELLRKWTAQSPHSHGCGSAVTDIR